MIAHLLEKQPAHCITAKRENRSGQAEEIENIEALTGGKCRIETSLDLISVRRLDFGRREKDFLNLTIPSFRDGSLHVGERQRSVFHFHRQRDLSRFHRYTPDLQLGRPPHRLH